MTSTAKQGLLEHLEQGPVICAEGYLFECERRGYLQAGALVPEVVLDHPEVVTELHREFVHAGSHAVEALIALDVIKQTGLPAVVTMALHREPVTRDGLTPAEACKRLEDGGADVVGLNCIRGPATMLPHLESIRAAVSCHVAALPVPYRTHDAQPTFQSLEDPAFDGQPFPT